MNNSPSLIRETFSKYKYWALLTFLAAAGTSLGNIFATLQISHGIDMLVGKNNVNFSGLFTVIFTLIILYCISAICDWIVAALSNRIAHSVVCDLRHKVFYKLGKLPLSYFDRTPHGDIISRFTNDLDSISDALSLSLVSLFTGVITVVGVLIVMFSINVKLALVILLITPLNFFIAWFVNRFSQKTFQKQQETVGELSGFISEMVGNQKTVKAFGYEKMSTDRFKEINGNLRQVSTKAHFAAAMINPSTRIVDHLSYIIVGVIGAFIALATGGLTIGNLSAFLMYSGQFSKPFNEISGIMANLQTAAAAFVRIEQIIYAKEEVADSPDAIVLDHPEGDISFDNVDFSYHKKQPLIQGLHIKAKPGDLIAIVGPTGAGKTTIVNLLMRFYEIDKGNILIDNKNIRKMTKDSLRKSFGMVLQETWLFNGTIRENITYGRPDATEEEIIAAAQFAFAHPFITQLPSGYDTIISEDGGNLSQGQKQLLTIARVMLTDPPLLILDEATSSIDTLTEIRVQKAFFAMMKDRTSFVIAHRLSTIVQADTILVLDKGQIIETGNHKELVAKKGFYYTLYNSQFQ